VQSHRFLVASGGLYIIYQGAVLHKMIFLESRDRTW
jgi:hypothetical protein